MTVCTIVKLPQDKDKVRLVNRMVKGWWWPITKKELYVGVLAELPRPPLKMQQIEDAWEVVQRDDLATHVDRINSEIRYWCQKKGIPTNDSILEPELLLTGYAAGSSIPLSPKIWFRCGSQQTLKIAEKEVAGLGWTADRGLGDKIEVGLRSAIMVADQSVPIPRLLTLQQGFSLPRGYAVFLNSQRPGEAASACGLLCSIAVKHGEALKYHSICRIGGIFSIKNGSGATKAVGVTAAHGLLDYSLRAEVRSHPFKNSKASTLARKRPLLRTLRGRGISAVMGLSRCNTSTSDIPIIPTTTAVIGKINSHDADLVEWEPIRSIHAANWLGDGWEAAVEFPFLVPEPEGLTPDADFALLELPSEVSNTYNTDPTTTKHVTRLLMENDMSSGPVDIIIAKNHVVQATLLSARPSLYLRGTRFPTRKIQLDKPLATGTSGCWVVQNDGLCGMVVASYEAEPFAHIITAQKLVNDIRKTQSTKALAVPEIRDTEDSDLLESHLPSIQELAVLRKSTSEILQKSRGEESSSPQVFSSPIQTRSKESLDSRLTNALIVSPDDRTKYFLPRDVLDTILDRESILEFLKTPSFDDDVNIVGLCDYICGTEVTSSADSPVRTARKIFAVLILIKKPLIITEFARDGVYDDDLPLMRASEHGAKFGLARRNEILRPLTCFSDWPARDIRLFDEYQWYMLAPSFTLQKDGKPLFYGLHDRIIMPWTEYEAAHEGGTAVIYKATIHPAHHNFHTKLGTDNFAVKRLRSDDFFYSEVEAHKMLPPHPHLVSLLCSFRFRGSYYLLYPWADGSLFDVWTANPSPPMTSGLLRWFWRQCQGIADGLAAIHTGRNSGDTATSSPRTFGRHGDIKPQNVLCFHNESSRPDHQGYGTLKLADFGLTKFHGPHSRSGVPAEGIPMTPTYRAPEIDVEMHVSQSYDIWALGCLYLEFITWMLLGFKGVEDFGNLRCEDDSRSRWKGDAFFAISESHGRQAISAEVKTSVTKNDLLIVKPGDRASALLVTQKLRAFDVDVQASNPDAKAILKISSAKGLEPTFDLRRSKKTDPATLAAAGKGETEAPVIIKTIDEFDMKLIREDIHLTVRRTVERQVPARRAQERSGQPRETAAAAAGAESGKRLAAFKEYYASFSESALAHAEDDLLAKLKAIEELRSAY
ncbi:hypothetical protein ACHAPT_013634 [Fusarium lateritium]